MRVSLKDIAEYTGLSKSTVSIHLNKHVLAEQLSTATKAKIDAAVKKFGYVPSYTARALSCGKTQTIGFVVADLALPYPARMASALMDEASKHDLQLLISATKYSPENEIKCLEDLRDRRADGIIYPLATDIEVCNRLVEEHYPMVLAFNSDDRFNSVVNDFSDAMRKGVAYFSRAGAKEVTIIADISSIRNDDENMYDSFIKACGESGCISNTEPVNSLNIAEINFCFERISRNPPDFMIVQGPLFMNILEQKLRCYQNKFPRIINIIASWELPPLRDEMLIGVIICYPDKIIRTAVDTLVRLIKRPVDNKFPFVFKEPAEFLLSWAGDACKDTIYEVKKMMGYSAYKLEQG